MNFVTAMLSHGLGSGWIKLIISLYILSGIPFPEKHIIMYFCYSGVYHRGKSCRGVLISTMKKYLTAFKIYCWARQRQIPIFEYTELGFLLQWYKYIQNIESPSLDIHYFKNKCQISSNVCYISGHIKTLFMH